MAKKPKKPIKPAYRKLAAIYARMADQYARAAQTLGLSCQGCEDNCCTSYFQHHTMVEWAYLWEGMHKLPKDKAAEYLERAEHYVAKARNLLAEGEKPRLMCPLNDDGLCGVYEHRLMICRLHGVPNRLTMPNGTARTFAGCFKSQALTQDLDQVPVLDRTPLLRDLAALELDFAPNLPRPDLTIAEMLILGPPKV